MHKARADMLRGLIKKINKEIKTLLYQANVPT